MPLVEFYIIIIIRLTLHLWESTSVILIDNFAGMHPTSAKWRDELTKTVQKGQKTKARGLAVVIYNSYENCPGISTLPGAIKDGEAMMDTFRFLQFAVLAKHNATRDDMRGIFGEVASYADYPEEYDCFAIMFAGHGEENSILIAIDGNIDFEKDIAQRFNKKLAKSDVSEKIESVAIIAFIDACRGSKIPRSARVKKERDIPSNMMLCYSTREEDISKENANGGIWMQKIAQELKRKNQYVSVIVSNVNKVVGEQNQNPISVNSTVTINLHKGKQL